jgi:hypothetical protein
MVVKILLWLEGFSPQFATAKHISEKIDCDMYAIINVNKAKEFYEKQKFMEFKKKWYFRDCFNKKDIKPDLDYLFKLEKKYKINLWNIAYSDIIFNKFNKYYKFKAEQILSIFEQECKFFENILDQVNPDFLIIRISDSSDSQLIQLICEARGIKILTQGFSRLGLREIISSEVDTLDSNENNKINQTFTFKELQNYSEKYVEQEKEFRENFKTSKINWVKGTIEYLRMINNSKYRMHYTNYGKNTLNVIKNESFFLLKKKIQNSFLKKYAKMKINQNEKFVYFPLQLEPERTLFIPAPFYTNQLEVILNIAKSLPIDYVLYVKEHPMQAVYGWRNTSYYKKILELPNVILIHPNFSNETLLENCQLLITITGTSGLEAAFHTKPSIVFTNVIYSSLPSVYRLKNLEDLPNAIKKSLKVKVNIDDLNLFINKIINNSFEFDSESLGVLFNNKFYYGGFLFDHNVSIESVKEFLEKHRELFQKLAEKHIEKIHEHKKIKL